MALRVEAGSFSNGRHSGIPCFTEVFPRLVATLSGLWASGCLHSSVLSESTYIYIYICVCVCDVYIYIYM